MKEYETQTLEELRCADYMAGRKGPGTGTTATANTGGTGLFGAAPNQTAPASGGLFGSTATTQQNTLFGANNQQQNKPLFGSTAGTTGGFGQPTSAFGQTNSAFGAPNTATSGGIFGAKPAGTGGFGAAATTTSSGFGFGGQTNTSTNMFGQNQNTGFGNKPFGAAQPQTSQPLFGSSTGGFGTTAAAPAFGTTGGTTGFGQPQQNSSIGLFGNQQNQAKPAFGFGGTGGTTFGSTAAATTTTPSFSFGQNTNTFGAQQKPPAFGATGTTGFGGTTGGFGTSTFGAAQPAQNNMFGSNAAKPAFGTGTSFGTTGGTSFGGTGTSFGGTTGGFGASTTGGLFGNNQAGQKPLFGGGSTSFGGVGSTSFGGTGGTSFNTGGTSFSLNQPQNQQQNQQAPQISLQSQLASLTSNPYGDNPLFKNLLPDQNRREEMLKPTNPVAQKAALNSGNTPYKVSPHLKSAKVKAIQKNTGNKSAIFEGLDEDENPEIFVPRSSVKKLVLKPKIPTETPEPVELDKSSVPELEESLNLPLKPLKTVKTVQVEVHDESFSNLITKPASKPDDTGSILTPPESADTSQELIEESEEPQPAGIKLKRAGYYTIPSMSELCTMVDPETGNLTVENFTIGRAGYGNIFFPGLTNIKNMNFDDIVFFRHKEVIVYPDDGKKPELGSGLNKKAQVTLDKVWPVDKTSHSSVKSPEKLQTMNYEEKLQKACLKLGARFVEYRPETGSWVFKVDHFSKYGLDDSDEDEELITKQKEVGQTKKLKTLQLRSSENTGM